MVRAPWGTIWMKCPHSEGGILECSFQKLLLLFTQTFWFPLLEILGDSLVAQMVKSLPAMQETQVQSLGWEEPLEKGMATHSSILAWRIPWTEEPCRPKSKESNTTEQLTMIPTVGGYKSLSLAFLLFSFLLVLYLFFMGFVGRGAFRLSSEEEGPHVIATFLDVLEALAQVSRELAVQGFLLAPENSCPWWIFSTVFFGGRQMETHRRVWICPWLVARILPLLPFSYRVT